MIAEQDENETIKLKGVSTDSINNLPLDISANFERSEPTLNGKKRTVLSGSISMSVQGENPITRDVRLFMENSKDSVDIDAYYGIVKNEDGNNFNIKLVPDYRYDSCFELTVVDDNKVPIVSAVLIKDKKACEYNVPDINLEGLLNTDYCFNLEKNIFNLEKNTENDYNFILKEDNLDKNEYLINNDNNGPKIKR